ncbi:hypothetical protein GGR54DRAFT_326025 [Hypoxylon sp. NC1633]|nr:hypothetical protein GGR54DRAFT_326025 [Hypoxylon sp. NC1633]
MTSWLQLVVSSSVPCQLYLQEFRSPYQSVDKLQDQTPGVIHVIGNNSKQQMLCDLSLDRECGEMGAIHLHLTHVEQRPVLLIDSSWPPCPLKRYADVENANLHLLDNNHFIPTPFDSTIKTFSKLLSIISHTVIIFMDDFPGFSNVIELLSSWVRFSRLDFRCRPRLLLVSKAFDDPTQVHTKSDSEEMCWRCFESVELLPSDSATTKLVLHHNQAILERRRALKWAFSAIDLRRIIRSAIAYFSQPSVEAFDIISALRGYDASQKNFKDHVEELVRLTRRSQYEDLSKVVASALLADAYPEHGHRKYLSPKSVFNLTIFSGFFADSIYKTAFQKKLQSLFQKLDLGFLENDIENAFYEASHQMTEESAFNQHLLFLKNWRRFFENKISDASCLTCLAMPSCIRLSCGHTICERCIRSTATATGYEPGHFEIPCCPLCQGVNVCMISLRPPTAAKRVLVLEVPMQHKILLGHFIKDLQSHVSLSTMSFRDHFDAVHAKGAGAYYALVMYLRGWNISQCVEGSKNIRDIRIKGGYFKKPERIEFGEDYWHAKEIQTHSGVSINVQHKRKCYYNIVAQQFKQSSPQDVIIRYSGNRYDSNYLRAAADQMIGALFYIELVEVPRLYSSPVRCKIRLMCCVPSGPACASLQRRLLGAEVRYNGDRKQYKACQLEVNLTNNAGFLITIVEVDVTSFESEIDVRVRKGSLQFVVGRCPY